ncbi:MAG TPA: glycosyltransferase family 25 protein [Albidovulum sp.]|uniref:glycosyltransferase family 25 protein n=1 Tax=Albidovulum sp. TaxID=1872424 RepID=UPI002C60F9ED|nr:glycosyltransferase family 25 protein [Albidovulum sp.]
MLNLDRARDRWRTVSDALDRLGLGHERVPAIDRLAPEAKAISAAFDRAGLARDYPATLGDICCSLTHRNLWRRIAAMDAGAVIVLEDDASPSPAFADFARGDLGAIMRAHGIGALKLEHWPGGERSRRFPAGIRLGHLDLGGGATLFRQAAGFLGTCAYAITPAAAGALLSAHPRMGVPVDHFMFSPTAGLGFPILRPAFVNPAPVLHDFVTHGSDILDERIASGIATTPRTWRRRFQEAILRRRLARGFRTGQIERVEMRWSGDGTPPGGMR